MKKDVNSKKIQKLAYPCPQCHNKTLVLDKRFTFVSQVTESGTYPVHCESCGQDNWIDIEVK